MANHQSAKKRIRQTEARRLHNKYYAKTARNAVRKLRATSEKEAALEEPAVEPTVETTVETPDVEVTADEPTVETVETPDVKDTVDATEPVVDATIESDDSEPLEE